MFVYCVSSLKFAGFPNHLRVLTMVKRGKYWQHTLIKPQVYFRRWVAE